MPRLNRPLWGLCAGFLAAAPIAACHEKPSPAEQAREDRRAIAMVEAVQTAKPPAVALAPEPLTAGDLSGRRLDGASCHLVPLSGGAPLLVADHRRAVLKLDGLLADFAADSGGPQLGPLLSAHYVGQAHALWLERRSDQAGLTIRDARDQIVFTTRGRWICSA